MQVHEVINVSGPQGLWNDNPVTITQQPIIINGNSVKFFEVDVHLWSDSVFWRWVFAEQPILDNLVIFILFSSFSYIFGKFVDHLDFKWYINEIPNFGFNFD